MNTRIPLTLLFPLLAASPLQAGPPLITDDPETLEAGKWEINVATTFEKRGGTWLLEAPLIDINYGILNDLQLKLEAPYLLELDGSSAVSGIGHASTGLKYRFLNLEKAGFSISTYPAYSWNNSSASVRRGLVESGSEFVLPFEFQYELNDKNLVYAEIGAAWVEHEPANALWGVAFEHTVNDDLEIMAELHGEGRFHASAQEVVFNVGFHWQSTEHVAIIGSVGRALTEGDEPFAEVFGYHGLQITF